MIEALRSAAEPAEIGIVTLGLIALVAQRVGARRTERGLLGLGLLWAGVACLIRDGKGAGPLLLDLPPEDWAGFVAVSHAVAAQVAWVAATVTAFVLGVGGLVDTRTASGRSDARPDRSPAGRARDGATPGSAEPRDEARPGESDRSDPSEPGARRENGGGGSAADPSGARSARTRSAPPELGLLSELIGSRRRAAAALGIAAALAAVAAIGAPHVGWTAPAFALAALVASWSPENAAAPASFAAAGAWFGSIAARYQVAVLAGPADVEHLDAAMIGSIAAAVAAGIALGSAVAARRPWVPLVLAGFAALFAGWGGLAYRPAAELVEVAPILPIHLPARAARMPGGCLVAAEGRRTVGVVVEREGVRPCPTTPTFPLEQAPLLALPGSAPVADLAGWHAPEVGSVRVLARLDDGWAMPAWRISAREVPVWAPTADGRVDPLPGAWLVLADPSAGRAPGATAAAGSPAPESPAQPNEPAPGVSSPGAPSSGAPSAGAPSSDASPPGTPSPPSRRPSAGTRSTSASPPGTPSPPSSRPSAGTRSTSASPGASPRAQPPKPARLRGVSATGESGDPVERVRLSEAARVDVLVHESAAPTVDDLLRVCAAFERARPVGLRCVLAVGDPDRWRRKLRPVQAPAPIEVEWETIEGDPDEGFGQPR